MGGKSTIFISEDRIDRQCCPEVVLLRACSHLDPNHWLRRSDLESIAVVLQVLVLEQAGEDPAWRRPTEDRLFEKGIG